MSGYRIAALTAAMPVMALEIASTQSPRLPKAPSAGFEAKLRDRTHSGQVVASDRRVWTCIKGRCRAGGFGDALAACRALAACNAPATAAATPRLQA